MENEELRRLAVAQSRYKRPCFDCGDGFKL